MSIWQNQKDEDAPIHNFLLQQCVVCSKGRDSKNSHNDEEDLALLIHHFSKAMLMAVDDVNRDENILNTTYLNITMLDSTCSAVQGATAAMDLLKGDVLAIAGPQTSAASHFVAELGSTLQVPIVSFGATDPSLSAKKYSYFVRLAYSDAMQMAAIAAVVGYFGWKEVVAIYQDDEHGMNGIYILSDALQAFRAKIIYKAALPPGLMKSCDLENLLLKLSNLESRVFIVHTPTSLELGISIFSQANHLGLITDEFVWIATEWLSSFLITTENVNPDTLKSVQGVIGTRPYVPKSKQRRKFMKEWNEKYRNHDSDDEDEEVSVFALYAYDSIWLLARAANATLINFTFGDSNIFTTTGNSDRPLKRFERGSEFLLEILKTKFYGTSGPIQIDPRGDLMNTAFEIINIVGAECRTIGYWTNHGGLTTSTPWRDNSIVSSLNSKQKLLQDVVWPGNGKRVPRGWVFPTSGRKLRVGVPSKKGFKEFITTEGNMNGSQNKTAETGFCVDVFEAAIKSVQYPVPYTFIPYGAGKSSPSYDDLVQQLVLRQVDAVVGDISITTNRSTVVDFTQPFIETGLVVVVPLKKDSSTNGWAFVRPFSIYMWITTGGFFVFVGVVVCLLEQGKNPHFQGERRKQFGTILW